MLSLRLRSRLMMDTYTFLNCSTPQAIPHSCTSSLHPRLCKNIHTHPDRGKQLWSQVSCHIAWSYISSHRGVRTVEGFLVSWLHQPLRGAWFVCGRWGGSCARHVWHSAPVTTAACTWLTTASAPRRALPLGEGAAVCVCRVAIWKTRLHLTNRINMHHFIVGTNGRRTDLEGSTDTPTSWLCSAVGDLSFSSLLWYLEVAAAASVHATDGILT